MKSNWWKETIVYQIYPRSFFDSNNDGIGDLNGITRKLDYLADLGVETLWISPFFKSPQKDFGYDISDYYKISKEYGTDDDIDRLIQMVHARDMKIVFDLVLNHTSNEHKWFIESSSSKYNPKHNYYLWQKGRDNNTKPPNNWKSMTGGSGWHYNDQRDQWYWAQFLPFQPDLNYREPEVQKEMLKVVQYWLRKGVDGFRLDIINALFEDKNFEDNPFSPVFFPNSKNTSMFFQKTVNTLNHPDTLEFMQKLKQEVDIASKGNAFLVGEVSAPLNILKQYVDPDKKRLDLVFLFQSMETPFTAKAFRKMLSSYEHEFPEPNIPTLVFGNHDVARRCSQLNSHIGKTKLNAAFQLTARGVPFIYNGEELGMEQKHIPITEAKDPVALKFKYFPKFIFNIAKKLLRGSIHRDESRTPMQWSPGKNAGFTSRKTQPWLEVHENHEKVNVSTEKKDPDSVLNCYRRFCAVRNKYPALRKGKLTLLDKKKYPKQVLAYSRETADSTICTALLNFSGRPRRVRSENDGIIAASTRYERCGMSVDKDTDLILAPWEGVLISED
ncbi:MAG: alpha-glucosidase [Spirochaetia bacterium]